MIYEDALIAARRHVAEAFKAGTATFPHYTLHGAEHLEELDRLALLIGGFIRDLPKERLDLLRLAVILHDFSMVNVPDPAREAELRKNMDPKTSFADVVRKTHQDEIERSFSRPERISFLQGLIPVAGTHVLEDACTVARHHRFHPLDKAPEHLRDLCALMRILDELDIGPKRAPLPAYEALRTRMEEDKTARFHWLKHICTRAVDLYGTLSVEDRNRRRVLKVFVAVKATEKTWRPIQESVLAKLRDCLIQEGVNDVLRSTLNVEFELAPAPEPDLSGVSALLATTVREDLDALPSSLFLSARASLSTENKSQPIRHPLPTTGGYIAGKSLRDFRIVAIPPEKLAETLCIAGRLTVIGNIYVQPGEEMMGGLKGSTNRIYVGPADRGKTRAALEWVRRLTEGATNQWVVLRTSMGTIPEKIENIVLDTSHYEERGYLLPQKAVLFLDDLPANLPQPNPTFSATDAVRILFRWYQDLPYFRERRLVGTLRLEDTHSRPEWPEVLPSLGQPLELVRLDALDDSEYRALWKGMRRGAITRSHTEGVSSFEIDMDESFLGIVAQRPADPEAVAVFVQQNVAKSHSMLSSSDAERFSESAVETWIKETWPAMLDNEVPARVFYTLARFFEAGIRPSSGFLLGIGPSWNAHEAFGPEMCTLHGADAASYSPFLSSLIADGHASGEIGKWIRPKFDFLIQSANLHGIELELPATAWFIERASRLQTPVIGQMALHLAASTNNFDGPIPNNTEWLIGWGAGLLLRAASEAHEDRSVLLDRARDSLRSATEVDPDSALAWTNLGTIFNLQALGQKAPARDEFQKQALDAYRRATDADPKFAQAWYNLGVALGQQADQQTDELRRQDLRDQVIDAYRKATDANPQNAQAWNNLGVALGQQADQQTDELRRQDLRDQEIDAYRKAIEADPKYSEAWLNLGVSLGRQADQRQDEQLRQVLRDQEIDAYRKATDADPNNSKAWLILGVNLGLQADQQTDEQLRQDLRDQEIDAYRKAIDADPNNSKAWLILGARLGQQADQQQDEQLRQVLKDQEIDAYHKATDADPNNIQAWLSLGVHLNQQADQQQDEQLRQVLKDQEIDAYRKATDVDPQDAQVWLILGVRFGQQADQQPDEQLRQDLRNQAINAYRKATDADPKNAQAWYNLGVALGQQADQQADETLRQDLRNQAINAYREATDADPKFAQAWNNLGAALVQQADQQADETLRQDLRDQAIDAYRKVTDADPKNAQAWYNLASRFSLQGHATGQPEFWERALEAARKSALLGGSRYNLACALALNDKTDEALSELQGCLARGEISLEHVKQDSDWTSLREDSRYLEILRAAEKREGGE